jgi:hypothetical protein
MSCMGISMLRLMAWPGRQERLGADARGHTVKDVYLGVVQFNIWATSLTFVIAVGV